MHIYNSVRKEVNIKISTIQIMENSNTTQADQFEDLCMDTTTMNGVVRWFNHTGNYGVIRGCPNNSDMKEYFVYVNETFDKLYDGIEVTFDAGYDQRNKRDIAMNVSYKLNSNVNTEILHKINKIDLKMYIAGSFEDDLNLSGNNVMLILTSTPVNLPDTLGELFNELMGLAMNRSVDSTMNMTVKDIVSRDVKSFTFSLDSDHNLAKVGVMNMPACLNHTHELLVCNFETILGMKKQDPVRGISNMKITLMNRKGVTIIFEYKVNDMVILTCFGVSTDVTLVSKHSFIKTSYQLHNNMSLIMGGEVMSEWKYIVKYPSMMSVPRK